MKNQTDNNSKSINFQTAQSMIDEYKKNHSLDSDYLASEYFDAETIRQLLSNPNCKGIRIYNSLKMDDGTLQNRFIIMAEDEKGKTILNFKTQLSAVSVAGLGASMGFGNPVVGIVENGTPCPPMCS